jgi:hypothetical protein
VDRLRKDLRLRADLRKMFETIGGTRYLPAARLDQFLRALDAK